MDCGEIKDMMQECTMTPYTAFGQGIELQKTR